MGLRLIVLRWIVGGIAVLFAGWIATGLVMAASDGPFKPAGDFYDIGGRKMRMVCQGPKGAGPVVWTEGGAFGFAADFAAIQEKLTAEGIRSCAYDRAGLGWSDAGPKPRDGNAITGDLEKLMAASGESGPYILVGHSMAGLYIRQFTAAHPGQVAGVVLVDAATPEVLIDRQSQRFTRSFGQRFRWATLANSVGLGKPLYFKGDKIGLPEQGRKEKRRAFVSGRHARNAYSEVTQWSAAARQAIAAGPYDPAMPVAVVVAGANRPISDPRFAKWAEGRQVPAKASRAGYISANPDANHNTLLGMEHGDAVVKGVKHVLTSLKPPS